MASTKYCSVQSYHYFITITFGTVRLNFAAKGKGDGRRGGYGTLDIHFKLLIIRWTDNKILNHPLYNQ